MNKNILYLITFILFLIINFAPGVAAESYRTPNYPYIRYNVDDGLPQSIISHLMQDSYGFLWIATNEGLAKFDGYSFQIFNEENGYPFRLITGIIEKEPGKIWISTISSGIWELFNNKLKKISIDTALNSSHVNFLIKTFDKEILIGTEPGGLFVLKNDSLILHLDDQNGQVEGPIISAAKDYQGNYWIGSYQNGVQVFKGKTKILHLTIKEGLPSNEIRAILPLPSGAIWIGTYKGFYIYGKPDLTQKLNFLLPEVFVSNIYTNNNEDIWINLASKPGGVLHIRNDKLIEILHANEGFYSKTTLIEELGTLFIGSYQGLIVHSNRNFENFGKESGLTDTYIRAIGKDPEGNILVATKNDGLYKFIDHHFIKVQNLENSLTGISIFDFKTIKNKIWLGTSRSLFIIDKDQLIKNKFTQFFNGMAIRRFEKIDDHFFIVTKAKIFKVENDSIKDYSFNLKDKRISIWGLAKDKNNHLVIATNGQGMFFLENQKWHQLFTSDSLKQFFTVRSDSENNLYFGSSNGLYKWDGQKFTTLLKLKKTVWDVMPTQNGIWALTSNGLYKLHNGRIRIYNHKNGLITTEFNMGALYFVNNNDIWFGGVDGLVHYYKIENYPDFIPKFYITHLQTKDSLFIYPFPSQITLQSDDNAVRFYFKKINFGDAPYFEFAYWLEGFNQDTILLKGDDIHYVDYTYLPDGNYTFQLYLFNPFTNEIAAQRFVSFIILRPWYKSTLFILSMFSLLVAFVYVIVHARESYLKKRNLMLEKQVQERTEDIRQSYKLLKKETEQRKKAQASLKKEQEQLEITLKSIADGVIRTDLNGKILLMNESAERILGVSAKRVEGKTLNEILNLKDETSDEVIKLPDYLQRGKSEKEAPPYFYARLELPGGMESKHINISWSKIREENEIDSGYVWVFRDISVERQLENEILKTQKLESIGLLAGGIAHDFNNILAGILGNTQLAKLNWQDGNDIQKYLDGIEEAAKSATHLTKQLLTFAKGGEPVKEIISLKKILIENVEFALRGSNVSCQFTIDEDLWPIEADKGQLNQVINNLVINAVQAMPGGGILQVEAKNCTKGQIKQIMPEVEAEYFVRIKIIDSGIGIPKENLPKIFDPYFTTKQKGSGLGLATTYAIIKKHDGLIKVDSELGKGTTFSICLPALPAAEVLEKEKKSNLVSFSGKRVLVMDDEEFIRELMGSFLEMIDVDVEFANDGDEAIEKYKKALDRNQRFDAVIMDLTIRGGMGGKDAVNKILKIDPEAKVIVASGYSTDSLLANYRSHGFVGRLSKPFTLEELNKVLTQVLTNSKKT